MMNTLVNKIHLGDCLDIMPTIDTSSVDLIYLDPPFFTEKKHTLTTRSRDKTFCFSDLWGSDTAYARFIYERITLMKPLLKETGSIFVHCDQHATHIIRAILDDVFGHEHFQSEIIWSYKRWSNAKKGLLAAHQTIYFYSKSKQFKFNKMLLPYSETTNIDQILQSRTRDGDNKSVYAVDEQGQFKHAKEKTGVPLSDVWEIPYLNPKAKERVGYPTQKPLLLLERIIALTTVENDLVLDPFCGSGTTCVAASLGKRQFIGIDHAEDAVILSNKRLIHPVKTESNVLKKGRGAYINMDKEALSLLLGVPFHPVQRNKGIDAILVQQFEGAPVLVRIQKNGETLAEAAALLHKAKQSKRAKKAILIQTEATDATLPVKLDGIVLIQSPSLQITQLLSQQYENTHDKLTAQQQVTSFYHS